MPSFGSEGSFITCPQCGMTSHNPQDILHGYCGNCHVFHSPPMLPEPSWAAQQNAELWQAILRHSHLFHRMSRLIFGQALLIVALAALEILK